MGEKVKNYIFEILGIIALGISIWHCNRGDISANWEFVMIILNFGLAVVMKLLVNQYVELSRAVIIDIAATINLLKIFILMFYMYLCLCLKKRGIELERFVLEYIVLDMVALANILYQVYYEYYKSFDIKQLIVTTAIGVMCCKGIRVEYINLCEMGSAMINMGLVFILLWIYKRKSERILGEGRFCMKLCLKFLIIQALFAILVSQNIHRYVETTVTFHLIQTGYLFYFTYRSCMMETWQSRVHQLNEAESRIMQQKETCNMIANLSHELKTPINIIRSALDLLLLENGENEEILKMIKTIKGQCNQTMNIIQDMIEIQKIKGHYSQEKPQVYNLVEVVENVVEAFCEELPDCKIVFNPLEEEIYQAIEVQSMQQSLMLLVGSLIQASGKELYIEMGLKDQEEVYIQFEHPQVVKLKEMFESIKQEAQSHIGIADQVTMKLIEYLVHGHQGKITYVENKEAIAMKLVFPSHKQSLENWLDPLNLIYLKDQIKARELCVGAINLE